MSSEAELAELIDPAFLASTIHQAAHLLHASGSGFCLCRPGSSQPVLVAEQGLAGVTIDTLLLRRVCESVEAIIDSSPGHRAVLAVPSVWQGSVRGVLLVVEGGTRRRFGQQDVERLRSIADLAAAALHQAERLARMTAQFRALHVIDVALTSSLQLDRVLTLILEKAVGLVGADHGSLRLLDRDGGELVLKAHLGDGWSADAKAYRFPLGHGITGWVAQHCQPYLCSDALADSQNVVLFNDMRSGVAVPLLVGAEKRQGAGELLGVLLLESTRQAAFDQQDVELLQAMAQESVIAIQNATRHERLQLMHQSLKDEQARRVAAENWSVMGQAATALAHRINNLIGIVPTSAGEVRRVLSGVELSQPDREWVEANLDRIERNGRFVLKLSDALFRPFQEAGPTAQFDVSRMLNEALQAADLPPAVVVEKDFAPALPAVESNSLLIDTFLELITNAGKAMAGREQQVLRVQARADHGGTAPWVVVQVSDTGCGIADEQMVRLWDMFKQSEEGIGFGLWWVRTFIEQQGGTICCESTPGMGTAFVIRLPAVASGLEGVAHEEGADAGQSPGR